MVTNKIHGIIVAFVLLTLIGCGSKPEVIKIGYIGPLSGPSAVLGMDAIQAIEIAANEVNAQGGINGLPIEIIAEDDQYIPAKTLTAYEKLVNVDGVEILLVSTYGGVFTIADRAQEDNVIVIDPLDCNNELAALPENVFCLATETESIGYALADYLLSQGKTRAGVMYSTKDNFMALVSDAFKRKFSQGGGFTKEENFVYTDVDFKTQLLKLNEIKPDAIVFLGHDETGIAMKQARDLGITAQFMATGTVTSPGLQQASHGAAEGTIFAYWEPAADNSLSKEFEAKFVSLVGRPPILPLTTHPAYDSMQVLIKNSLPQSVKRVDRTERVDAIRRGLYSTKRFEGTTGEITMDSDGAVRIKESAFRLENGRPVLI